MINALSRRLGPEDDGGFALLFVLFVTTVVMIGTASVLTLAAGGVRPAKQSQDADAALAAAQAGVQDFLSRLDAYCPAYSTQQCAWLQSQQSTPVTGTIGNESYSVVAQSWHDYLTLNGGTLRIRSTGTSPVGSPHPESRSLTADVSGKPSPLAFTYVSDYETLGTSFLNSYYGPRTITINDLTEANAAGLPVGTTVAWKGAGATRTDANTDGLCDSLYYNSASNSAGGLGRGMLKQARAGLPVATDFAEDGATSTPLQQLVGASTTVTRFAPCEVTFSKGMTFTGPVYSRDALYLSNGDWNSTAGPRFAVPSGEPLPAASTPWSVTSTPAAGAAGPYRSFPFLGGAPASGSGAITSFPFDLSLPSSANPSATCTYTGPTRILLSGTTATVTSPLTSSGAGACYTSTGSGGGVVSAKVPVDVTTISVQDAPAGRQASLAFPGLTLGANGDITTYDRSAGDAYVEGTLTGGRLSLVTSHDIIATGDIRATNAAGAQPGTTNAAGEPGWQPGTAAIDLVATANVRVYHPVACRTGNARDGYCPNDIGGLYTTAQAGAVVKDDGTLRAAHPSLQYCTLISGSPDCDSDLNGTREIDAAVFALNGSLNTDNPDRGRALGTLLVNGGVYENHRGATGKQWEIPTATSTRHNSGYVLKINYLSYQHAGLGYVPELQGGNALAPWQVISMSSGGTS